MEPEWTTEEIPKDENVDAGVRILFNGVAVMSVHFCNLAEPMVQITSDNLDLFDPLMQHFNFFSKHYDSLTFKLKEFTSTILTH